MANVKHLWSSVPWLVSFVLAFAFVDQRAQLRKAQREMEEMREHKEQTLQAKWQLAGHYRRLELERRKLAQERQEYEQRQQKAAQQKSESMERSNLLARLFEVLRPRKPLPSEPGPKEKGKHGAD